MNLIQGSVQGLHPIRLLACVALAAVLAACSSTPRAPVENRSFGATAAAPRVDPATLAGHEFAGKPGYYTVQQGDTLRSVARANNLDWRDLVHWNSAWVPNPDQIEIGQVLRIVPPQGGAARPVAPAPAKPRTAVAKGAAAASASTDAPDAAPEIPTAGGGIALGWPTRGGSIVAPYDGVKNKGIGIGGKEGDAVLAAAGGKVIYANSGLRGYGNLIIIQHNGGYMTVYAHNSKLLVKENEIVKKGQHIAEMGRSDADRVKLHFEVRRGSKTINPINLLPPR